jgi:hypothetical protein
MNKLMCQSRICWRNEKGIQMDAVLHGKAIGSQEEAEAMDVVFRIS